MLKKISNILIIIGLVLYVIINFINICIINTNSNIISSIQYKDNMVNYYVGYIEIKDKIKVPLVYGTSDKELNQNIVGISNYSNNNHLILAGHAIESVFLPLYKISINTKITILINGKYYTYYVDKKYIVFKDDLSVYDNNGLTLITCINKNKRLIIHAKTAN